MIKNSHPFISAVIPAYNAENYLTDAVDSVMAQNYKNMEIIIVDDGSRDGTLKLIQQLEQKIQGIRYISQKNRGPAAARNRGIQLAKGDYITFLDSDDLWPEQSINSQLEHLHQNSGCQIVWGKTQFFRSNEKNQTENLGEPLFFLNVGSALFHKNLFGNVGYFDENLTYSEDLDWFNRARENNISIVKHRDVVLHYRCHDDNLTKDKKPHELGLIKVLKQSLNRRRNRDDTVNELPGIKESRIDQK